MAVDRPSFSATGGPESEGLDVRRHHRSLVAAARGVLAPGGVIRLSTNHQRFESELEGLGLAVEETTERTVPPDCRNRKAHRSWRLTGP